MNLRAQFCTTAVIAGLLSGAAFASDPTASLPAGTLGAQLEAARQPGPSVSIARRIVDAAGAFERYARTASAVNPEFDGAASVSGALTISAAYETHQLEEGAVAYAALVALQQPTFVDALGKVSVDPAERAAYLERLVAKPDLVLEIPGAPKAAVMASAALHELGAGLVTRGRAVANAAYDVQHQPWALEPVAEPSARLAQVEAAGQHPARLTDNDTNQLLATVVARGRNHDADDAAAAPTGTVLKGLVLAAAAMLGQADEARGDALSPLLADADNSTCLRRAKLDLHQCLAASGAEYEDVFCAGQHAMAQTGQCIVKAAGGNVAHGVRVPIAATAYAENAAASVAVPIAGKPLTAAAAASAPALDRPPPADAAPAPAPDPDRDATPPQPGRVPGVEVIHPGDEEE